MLLEKKVDVNAQGERYNNVLLTASIESHDQVVQKLLKERAKLAKFKGVKRA